MEKVYLGGKNNEKQQANGFQSTVKTESTTSSSLEKSGKHRLELDGHQLISVWGVKGVPAFGDKEIKIQLDGELLTITGQNLEIKLLDLEKGQLIAKGYVGGMKYSSASVEKGVLKKIFK